MGGLELHFERELEFPPVIVWDALVDSTLVSGWLAEALVDPVPGGEYSLRWMNRVGQPVSLGRITALRAPELLEVDTGNAGLLRFALTEVDGGSRGTSTLLRLRVEVDVEPVFAARVTADWMTTLDQLGDLLRGHPVDWATWERDRMQAWTRHLRDVAG